MFSSCEENGQITQFQILVLFNALLEEAVIVAEQVEEHKQLFKILATILNSVEPILDSKGINTSMYTLNSWGKNPNLEEILLVFS